MSQPDAPKANVDGSWRRDDERHDNVLVDATELAALLAPHGLGITVGTSFGTDTPGPPHPDRPPLAPKS